MTLLMSEKALNMHRKFPQGKDQKLYQIPLPLVSLIFAYSDTKHAPNLSLSLQLF